MGKKKLKIKPTEVYLPAGITLRFSVSENAHAKVEVSGPIFDDLKLLPAEVLFDEDGDWEGLRYPKADLHRRPDLKVVVSE